MRGFRDGGRGRRGLDGRSWGSLVTVAALVGAMALATLVVLPHAGVARAAGSESFVRTGHLTLSPSTLSSPGVQVDGLFGYSVANSGGTMVVGAPGETVLGHGDAGRVYVYSASRGTLLATLAAPVAQNNSDFGFSVAISGKTIVVGAPGQNVSGVPAGTVYLFSTSGHPLETLVSPHPQVNGFFGYSVSISKSRVAVGAPTQTVNGQADAGNAYVFTTHGTLQLTLTSPDALYYGNDVNGVFGKAVAISGTTLVVGAPFEASPGGNLSGHAYVYKATNGALLGILTSPNAQLSGQFGWSVAISGTTVAVGAPAETVAPHTAAGHVYLFNAKSDALLQTLTSPTPETVGNFGYSVAVSGSTAVVGAPGENASAIFSAGNAYTFTTSGILSSTLDSLHPLSSGYFGYSVSASGAVTVVGAPDETASGQTQAGNVYVF